MVRKRPHTKSRNGCDECKKRRVKCDESRPYCSNCVSRELECHFSRPASVLPSPNQNPRSVSSDPYSLQPGASTSGPSPDASRGSIRLRELELMHQWCTKTCYSFTGDIAQVFQSYIPKEAIKHEFLMDSILALTSLHLATETADPAAAASYVGLALQYQNKALSAFYTALRNITPTNCDAVFAAAIITMASAVVSPIIPTGNNDHLESPTNCLLLLLDFMKGIGSVVEHSRQWLEQGPLIVLLKGRLGVANALENETILPIQHLRHLNDVVVGNENPFMHNIYERAIAQLEACFVIDRNKAMTWLVVVGKDFVKELRNGEPMAQLIFMYLGVIFDQMDDMWWAKHSGKRLVEELAVNLLNQGEEWAVATRWALVQVGCNGTLMKDNNDR